MDKHIHNSKVVFHVDMDAFYASVEVLNNPSLKGKPVIVGARPGGRGVVSAASYEARKFGVHSAMPINQAYEKCPQGIFLLPNMKEYIFYSKKLMDIFYTYTPQVEQISVDEAFLDMTGTKKLYGPPLKAAQTIQKDILEKLKLTCSIGVAPNKYLAKIASDVNKPFGITLVPDKQDEIVKWLAPFSIKRIWGVGKKTSEILEKMGIDYVSDLQRKKKDELENKFGKMGLNLYNLSRGIDFRIVEAGEKAKSISREHTFSKDNSNIQEWKKLLLSLSSEVAQRARKANMSGKTVVLTYRNSDFSRHSKRKTLALSTNSSKTIFETAVELIDVCKIKGKKIRLIGVGITHFDNGTQTDLFFNQNEKFSWEKTETAMDKVKQKFGNRSISFGGEL